MKRIVYLALFILMPSTAEAYIGPGLGTGAIGVVLGILASIFLALIAIVWYPLKRLFKMLFKKKQASTASAFEETEKS